ncbi:NAD-dependent epimerase/dehydratase family protein [Marinicrinis lubricantis]|uniref:NAD-dependent epimerase/dehydratase family protein n=1 Tax=Marinicrinis lubricantis TaxID=2086470 RepID=A0ABW1IUI7_9BACL
MSRIDVSQDKQLSVFSGKTVLVTGGAGFLGSNVAKRLLPFAKKIYVYDDLFTGKLTSVPTDDKVEFIQGSVTDGHLLGDLIEQSAYVFHFAARNIILSTEQPFTDFQVNAQGTLQVLLQAMRSKGRLERIIYASTSSLYGNPPVLPAAENYYDVSTPYAASKMCGELLCMSYAKAFQLPVTALRFSNVFGPGQVSTNPYCGVVSKFMDRYIQGEPLTIYGDGTQTRDFTYVEDAMDAVMAAAVSEQTLGQVMNVGTGIETQVNELADMIKEVIGAPEHPVTYEKGRAIDTIYRRSVDISKLTALTGWLPKYPLKQGIKLTWEWFHADHGNEVSAI